MTTISRIVSGGQTGADRAALDLAIQHGIDHGGWCPHGRRAEDGPLDAHYALTETPSAKYEQRTKRNVRDSDATVIISMTAEITGGTKLTQEHAANQGKPCLHITAEDGVEIAAQQLRDFVEQHGARTLNVAGPRASKAPEIYDYVVSLLTVSLR